MRSWKKYLNHQKYSECQLVTALNAYYYLTGETYCVNGSVCYERLVDLCHARHGSAISIEKTIHKELGLKVIGYSNSSNVKFADEWYELDTLKKWIKGRNHDEPKDLLKKRSKRIRLPIEVNVWYKRIGFHSVLIVDHCLKSETLRITNFKDATSMHGWMFAEDLYQFVKDANKGWLFRLFGLKEK